MESTMVSFASTGYRDGFKKMLLTRLETAAFRGSEAMVQFLIGEVRIPVRYHTVLAAITSHRVQMAGNVAKRIKILVNVSSFVAIFSMLLLRLDISRWRSHVGERSQRA